MKKILVIYAKYGGGHLAAAKAISSYIKKNYSSDCEVKCVDCVEYFNKIINNFTTKGYISLAKNAPKLWKKVYYGSTKGVLSGFCNITNTLIAKKIKKLFDEFKPDLVISTHPFGGPITAYLKKHNKTNCELATVFTDFAPHYQWLVGKEYCSNFFVSNEKMKNTLIKDYKLDEKQVHATGIPLSSAFSGPFDDKAIYEKYNLSPNKKLILFFGGGEFGLGQKRTIKILESLSKHLDNYQILAISGKNKKMYNSFIELSKKANSKDLHIIDYTTDVPGLMHISSLVVTKPGGLTSSESLASNLPILITTPIPGQEEENAEFLEESGSAVWLKKDDNIDVVINNLLSNEHTLNLMKEKTKIIAKPNSTKNICEILLKFNKGDGSKC